MGKIKRIRSLVQHGLYYLTEHAYHEAMEDGFDIFDVEYAILGGKMRRSWPREKKYEIVGLTPDGRPLGVICRITAGQKVRIITAYEDRQKQ